MTVFVLALGMTWGFIVGVTMPDQLKEDIKTEVVDQAEVKMAVDLYPEAGE